MTLMSEIATEALREIGVVAEDEQATADQIANSVRALNRMLSGWNLRIENLEHTELSATDTFPLDAKFEEGTVYNLAARLAGTYTLPVSFDAEDWFRNIQSAYATIAASTIPVPLSRMPSQYWPRTRIR